MAQQRGPWVELPRPLELAYSGRDVARLEGEAGGGEVEPPVRAVALDRGADVSARSGQLTPGLVRQRGLEPRRGSPGLDRLGRAGAFQRPGEVAPVGGAAARVDLLRREERD